MSDIGSIFSAGGYVADALSGFEDRPQQRIMAGEIWSAFKEKKHAVIEAGTGVGKSYAYLVPSILFAIENEPVVITTRTLNLQDQLINKDLPFLEEVIPHSFKYRVLKGRTNYVCLRRMKFLDEHKSSMLYHPAEQAEFELLKRWAMTSATGTRDDIPFIPGQNLWGAVCCEKSACRGRKCGYYNNCFYHHAVRKLGEADVVVANHSLYFADLAIIAEGEVTSAVLPEHRYAVFDEAHTIEDAARSHIGVRVSNFQLSYLLNGLFNAEKKSGFLSDFGSERARSACAEAGAAAEHFFAGVRTSAIAHSSQGELLWELGDNDTFDDVITPALSDLSSELREFRSAYDENDPGVSDMIAELDLRHDRVLSLNHHLTRFINREPDPNFVNWIEYGGGESGKIVSLHRNPIDISGYLRENLFGKKDSVVMTGATISISGGEDFSYFTDTVGLDDYRGVRLDSPFDFENRVVLHLGRTLPSPKSPGYAVKAMEKIKDLIPDCSGGVLLLFTSYRMMNDFSEELQPYIEKMGRTVFIQGQEKNRSVILREFQEAGNGVLFATSSFWMGVDVPGEALSNVFIMRLPFSVPNHPIIRGKCRLITEKGGNSFMDYTLPEAVLTFRQGVGRLLRNQNDRGTVAVFDSRIVNSRYGRYFLSSIPHCRREYF